MNARKKYVGKSQSCMVVSGRFVPPARSLDMTGVQFGDDTDDTSLCGHLAGVTDPVEKGLLP